MLKLAYVIAHKAHENQYDKGGAPYIEHPKAVADLLETESEKIVAYLHDVVEDSDVTLEDLEEYGFDQDILLAVDCMTKHTGERYGDYLDRVCSNPLATRVKIADLSHNSDISRIKNPTEKDFTRVQKYKHTLAKLQAKGEHYSRVYTS